MSVLFALTLFLGSALVFLIQPIYGKRVLPILGGGPGVWNTCMVFFQAGLLAGYAYALAGPRRLGIRRHAFLHLLLLLAPFLLLTVAGESIWASGLVRFPEHAPAPPVAPVFWLLGNLLMLAGIPYILLAAGGSLLQKWFAFTAHRSAADPYFLYAASNLGSMLALLSYPFLVEPNFSLSEQGFLWTAGYGLLILSTFFCALCLWRAPGREKPPGRLAGQATLPSPVAVPLFLPLWGDRLRWLALALVPSSLMLSVTTYLTTDIAAIPLLWLAPLAFYLLTFVLTFSGQQLWSGPFFARWMPLVVIVLVLVILMEATEPLALVLHLLGFFWIAMVCHGELARSRPSAEYLSEFYLWLALGGVLGGLFNALAAPWLFRTVAEYPLMLVLACLLRPGPAPVRALPRPARLSWPASLFSSSVLDFLLPLLVAGITAGLIGLSRTWGLESRPQGILVAFSLPLLICYTFLDRPLRQGLALGAIMLASTFFPGVHGQVEYRLRSFFGVHRVTRDPSGSFRVLVHGNTEHGQQSLDSLQKGEPLTYYHRRGPIGQVFAAFQGDPRLERVAVVGLGTGALACYSRVGQQWTFFEIDPAVIHIARDSGLFSYLQAPYCRGNIRIVPEDGRLGLAASEQKFGLIIMDAFTSDAIPQHLLTREALQVFRSRLLPGGILAFHISNRFLNLEPVLANLARAASPSMVCLVERDLETSPLEKQAGKWASEWALLLSKDNDVEALKRFTRRHFPGARWEPAQSDPDLRLWTDDYANLFSVLRSKMTRVERDRKKE